MEQAKSLVLKGKIFIPESSMKVFQSVEKRTDCHMEVTYDAEGDVTKVACVGTCASGNCNMKFEEQPGGSMKVSCACT